MITIGTLASIGYIKEKLFICENLGHDFFFKLPEAILWVDSIQFNKYLLYILPNLHLNLTELFRCCPLLHDPNLQKINHAMYSMDHLIVKATFTANPMSAIQKFGTHGSNYNDWHINMFWVFLQFGSI